MFPWIHNKKSFGKTVYSKVVGLCFCPKLYFLGGIFKGLLTPDCILKGVILVKNILCSKTCFLSNTVHAQTMVLSNQSACFGILPSTPPPPPHRILVCTHTCIPYIMNWNYFITCGGGDLTNCPADSEADVHPGGGGTSRPWSTGDVPLNRVPFLSFQLWHPVSMYFADFSSDYQPNSITFFSLRADIAKNFRNKY